MSVNFSKQANVARRRDNGTVPVQNFARDTALAAARTNFEIGDLVILSNNAAALPADFTLTATSNVITTTSIGSNALLGLAASSTPYAAIAGNRDAVVNLAYGNVEFSLPYLANQAPAITHVGSQRTLNFNGVTRQYHVDTTTGATGPVIITRIDQEQVGLNGGRVWVRFVPGILAPQVGQ